MAQRGAQDYSASMATTINPSVCSVEHSETDAPVKVGDMTRTFLFPDSCFTYLTQMATNSVTTG
jgi:hypothetical protein